MFGAGCLGVTLFVLLSLLLPVLFGQLLATALFKLHLSPAAALLSAMAIFFGGLINVPVKRIVRTETLLVHPLAVFGLGGFWPRWRRLRKETIIAVNLGGCLVPTALALYETGFILMEGLRGAAALSVAVLANVLICYGLARPVPGVGIAMPALVPALVAVMCSVALIPELATPVAFVAGVTGPLVGADLLHLRDIEDIATGAVSIGGAGTFDGIVLSGIVAAYLA